MKGNWELIKDAKKTSASLSITLIGGLVMNGEVNNVYELEGVQCLSFNTFGIKNGIIIENNEILHVKKMKKKERKGRSL
jgi:hypothetical protein